MTNITDEALLRLWGKSDEPSESDGDAGANWHPLLFHLFDVGFVTLLLWDRALPAGVRRRIAAALGFADDAAGLAVTRRLVILLAAQHDLGKASSFQTKVGHLWTAASEALGLKLPKNAATPPHGFVTTKLMQAMERDSIGGWCAPTAVKSVLARVTGGHHGKFPTGADLLDTAYAVASGDEQWDAVRAALLAHVERQLFPDDPDGESPEPPRIEQAVLRDAAIVPLVGGLISVADWIGSSQEYFAPAGKSFTSIEAYAKESRARAEKALDGFGWTPTPKFKAPAAFGELFQDKDGNPFTPNPMQERVAACADAAAEPYLLIVEAAMGEGKTEAALYAVDRALSTGLAHGFYLALPTQATGNAMFRRVIDYLKRRGHGETGDRLNLQLAHGGSFLSDDAEALRREANVVDKLRMGRVYGDGSDSDAGPRDGGKSGKLVAETWFTYRKRPLLAPFGVGTIDQSLVGVLQTKHWFVRLFGLAGKVVVFDEVHAYDVYMSRLLGRLLGWLRLLGCTVILLSATLPETKRRELIEAWQSSRDEDALMPNAANYPRVTFVGRRTDSPALAEAWTVGQTNPEKTVAVAYAGLDFADLSRRLTADLPDGGCAALICNTVGRAQEAYETLSALLAGAEWEVMLFHARTLAKWRQETEREVLRRFGKEGATVRFANNKERTVERPRKCLLIATQVVEQSLDLDFDWMASEIAPVDLLLQRMGRLWRHHGRKNRSKSAKKPLFYVLCGPTGESDAQPPELPPYSNLVYEPYVLYRTRLALSEGSVTLPRDIEPLIESVYDREPNLDALSAEWRIRLRDSEEKMNDRQGEDERKADIVMVASSDKMPRKVMSPGADAESENHPVYEDDDPRVHPDVRAATRLGEPSISVICLGTDADGGRLADPASKETEPSKWVARTLMGWSLSLSQRALFDALKQADVPTMWKESPYLRFHRALEFDHGVAELAGYTLRLRAADGLRIEKQGSLDEQ